MPPSNPADVVPSDRMFPTLTPEQVSRIAAQGRRRSTTRGEVLVEAGDSAVPFFVVLRGEVQAVRPTGTTETALVSHHPGQFSGEANMLIGSRAIVFASRSTRWSRRLSSMSSRSP